MAARQARGNDDNDNNNDILAQQRQDNDGLFALSPTATPPHVDGIDVPGCLSTATTSDSTHSDLACTRPHKRVRLSDSDSATDTADQHTHSRSHHHHSHSSPSSRHRKLPHMASPPSAAASASSSSSHSNGQPVPSTSSTNGHGHAPRASSSNGTATGPGTETADYIGFRPIYPGSRIDRKELVRLTVQSLRELGYESSARSLESESGVTLEHPSIGAFRTAVLNGDWRNAERLLIDGLNYAVAKHATPQQPSTSTMSAGTAARLDYSSVLRDPEKRPLESIRFLIQQQRYLELLEARHVQKALAILRDRLTPLHHATERLHQLSSLVMCDSPEELRARADWAGSGQESRRKLLQDIELAVSPSVMLPSRRLPYLLEQAQTLQKHLDPFYNLPQGAHVSLYADYSSDRSVFPTRTTHVLRGHTDEVWVMAFSHDGRFLASGGKDRQVIVWSISPKSCEKVAVCDVDGDNAVTCLAWSPDDDALLIGSDDLLGYCEWDGSAFGECQWESVHQYAIFGVAWLPDGSGYVSGSTDGSVNFYPHPNLAEDNTLIRQQPTHTWKVSPWRVLSLAITPDGKDLVAVSWRPADTANAIVTTRDGTRVSGGGGGTGDSSLVRASSTTTTSSQGTSPSESASPMSSVVGQGTEVAAIRSGGSANGFDSTPSTGSRYKLSFYDIAKKEEVAAVYMDQEITSVSVSQDSRYALINLRPNEAQVWDIDEHTLVSTYTGHRLARDMIRCCFGGSEQNFVASGSEDSSIYVWHRRTGKLLDRLTGHGFGTVNTVAWHPKLPSLLASCSDDATIRIWQPDERAKNKRREAANGLSGGASTGEGARAAAARHAGLAPFPWSMSPARAASPEADGGEQSGMTAPLVFLSSEGSSMDEDEDSHMPVDLSAL